VLHSIFERLDVDTPLNKDMKTKDSTSYLRNTNRYYDLMTGVYQLYVGEHFHLFLWSEGETREEGIRRTNDMFLSDGKLNFSSRVVDLGCGIGSLAILIAKRYGCEIFATNINEHQLKIAKKRAKQCNLNIDFIKQDVMELDFGERFDAAFLIDVEPHLPDKENAIANIKSLLRVNGRLVMTAWLQDENPSFAQMEFLIRPFCKLIAFPYMETFRGYRKIFKKQGLRTVKSKDLTNEFRRSVEDFYSRLFKVIKGHNSLRSMSQIVKNPTFLKTITTADFRKAAEDAFLGPIYIKLCMDAGVLKLGYFVLEKK
jgi:cyclopropane fatty-acyl-phospholipid synthase-like methyltransferase